MVRTQQQNEHIRDARKEKIRSIALKIFSEKGLFATRIKDIAKEAEMAQGLLYHYYPSKDAIYVDLIDNALEKMNEGSLYVRNMDAPADEKILFALKELFNTIEKSDDFRQTCRFIAQATNSTAIPQAAQTLIDAKRDVPYQLIAEVMRQGQQEGSIVEGEPYQLAVLFWTSVNGLAIYYATRKNRCELPDYQTPASMFLKDKRYRKD